MQSGPFGEGEEGGRGERKIEEKHPDSIPPPHNSTHLPPYTIRRKGRSKLWAGLFLSLLVPPPNIPPPFPPPRAVTLSMTQVMGALWYFTYCLFKLLAHGRLVVCSRKRSVYALIPLTKWKNQAPL